MGIEEGGVISPEADANRLFAASALDQALQSGMDFSAVREHFDVGRYSQATLESAAHIDDELVHDPAVLREDAEKAFADAAEAAREIVVRFSHDQ